MFENIKIAVALGPIIINLNSGDAKWNKLCYDFLHQRRQQLSIF